MTCLARESVIYTRNALDLRRCVYAILWHTGLQARTHLPHLVGPNLWVKCLTQWWSQAPQWNRTVAAALPDLTCAVLRRPHVMHGALPAAQAALVCSEPVEQASHQRAVNSSACARRSARGGGAGAGAGARFLCQDSAGGV